MKNSLNIYNMNYLNSFKMFESEILWSEVDSNEFPNEKLKFGKEDFSLTEIESLKEYVKSINPKVKVVPVNWDIINILISKRRDEWSHFLTIFKEEDEWFFCIDTKKEFGYWGATNHYKHYKCDSIDGLYQLIRVLI
jgi:hypothetical protein